MNDTLRTPEEVSEFSGGERIFPIPPDRSPALYGGTEVSRLNKDFPDVRKRDLLTLSMSRFFKWRSWKVLFLVRR